MRYPETALEEDPSLWPDERIFHGVIGLKTTQGSGSSTVAQYAAAAGGLGLQFLVFVDEYSALTNTSWGLLKARPAPPPSPSFVPGLTHVRLIELRQALISYQDYHLLLLTLAGRVRGALDAEPHPVARLLHAKQSRQPHDELGP